MHFSVELSYLLPPLLNLLLLLLTSKGDTLSPLAQVHDSIQFDQYPLLKLASLVFAISFVLLFLLTSVKLHLSAPPITLRTGYFSGPLTLSMLASVFLPPPLFWFAYFVIIITCPLHGRLCDSLKCFFTWFVVRLKSIPTFVITCAQQQQDNTEAAQPLQRLAVESVDIEENLVHKQPSLD